MMNEIYKLKEALYKINTVRGSTTNFGVCRAIACKALGIAHTDSKDKKGAELALRLHEAFTSTVPDGDGL